jgi:uncharacterized phage-associated protein
MMTIDDCADYIIYKLNEDERPLNVLKLQKLMYYVQAWHLAHYRSPMFHGHFEAWIHGPVNPALYARFRRSHQLYGMVTIADVKPGFDPRRLGQDDRAFIDSVIEAYGGFSGSQLEDLTHRELPWSKARGSLGPTERCEAQIDEQTMADFYRARL